MKISQWLEDYAGISIIKLRKMRLSNEEWQIICEEYEKYCESKNIKPDYDR